LWGVGIDLLQDCFGAGDQICMWDNLVYQADAKGFLRADDFAR
jgi:hypothetical protein